MPKERGLIVPIITLGVVVATIVAVGAMRLFSILPGNLSPPLNSWINNPQTGL